MSSYKSLRSLSHLLVSFLSFWVKSIQQAAMTSVYVSSPVKILEPVTSNIFGRQPVTRSLAAKRIGGR